MASADADAAVASLRSAIAPANLSLISALLACAIAQFLKPFTTWYFLSLSLILISDFSYH